MKSVGGLKNYITRYPISLIQFFYREIIQTNQTKPIVGNDKEVDVVFSDDN